VTGRVLAGNGQALAGAEVELLPLLPPHENARRLLARSLPEAIATARSDREGRFRVAAPQPGMWRIVVRHPAHLAMTCHLRPLLYDRALPEVQLLDRSQRSFKVVDEQGQPVAGLFLATVSWPNQKRPPRPPKGWLPEVSYLETAADGTVTVAGHPDAVVLLASVHDDRFLLKTLPWNDRKDELHLVEPMLPVRLVDPRGRPAANLFGDIEWLAFYFPVGISDKDGEILLPSRPAHRVRIAFFDGDGTYPRGVAKEKSDEE
ncbi:MAG: DUF4198 domain-containing protein, partial [bacterium]|nr:DUF4198 domain-containing protein [bacterium]